MIRFMLEMLRRRQRKTACVLVGGIAVSLLVIYFLSSCTEVSYIVQFSRHGPTNAVFPHSAAGGALFVGPCPECKCPEKQKISHCEPIDVALVIGGSAAAARATTLVKSLLFYRRNPLRLHLIVDEAVSHRILSTLFRTWRLPAVSVSFYLSSTAEQDVSWVQNKHYSGVYGLLKLTLPKLLPNTLERVIVLDADVLFVADVAELWSLWKLFEPSQAIGLVENLSDWYLEKMWKRHRPWPALGRGFNTGVILMDLGKLRRLQWMRLWREVAETELQTQQFVALADQDIFNAVIKERPELIFRLRCEWNLQLGDRSLQNLCQTDVANLKIVHWNSPYKTKGGGASRYAEFFRRHYQTFLDMDGALFRRELLTCTEATLPPNITGGITLSTFTREESHDGNNNGDFDEDGCYELRRAGRTLYRTHLYYAHFSYSPKESDVTLVTQLSLDRLLMLSQLLEHWDGPVSVACYLSDAEARQLMVFIEESPILSRRQDVAYHIVYKEGAFFPVNYLRNVALEHVVTPFVYLTDVDLLPNFGQYDTLRQAIATQGLSTRAALVVPAFESARYRLSVFPRSKAELLNAVDGGRLAVFRHDVWPQGHRPTDYTRWRGASTVYTVGWKPDYEPYIVVSRDVPPYDTRFLGFGWNKVSHIMMLNSLGYDFLVLPMVFSIHLPHAPSFEIAKYRASSQYRKCLKELKGQFIKELAKRQQLSESSGKLQFVPLPPLTLNGSAAGAPSV